MQPRMLVTFDEELRPLPVSVRVGQVKCWVDGGEGAQAVLQNFSEAGSMSSGLLLFSPSGVPSAHFLILQAVDVVGQAGKPKTITGFQTHTTPVLLAHGERAELATEEFLPVTPILEGFVILRKNPNYDL